MSCINNKVLICALALLGSLLSLNGHAWGTLHSHGGWGYGPGPGYYGPGAYPGWGGPNVIINVPIIPAPPPPYYVRECETVEVCDDYDECWLERRCF